MNITYKQLAEQIEGMTEEQKCCNVTVFVPGINESYPVDVVSFTTSDNETAAKSINDINALGIITVTGLSQSGREKLTKAGISYIDVKTQEIMLRLLGFHYSKSIVPKMSLKDIIAGEGHDKTKAPRALSQLKKRSVNYEWTITKLANISGMSVATAYKLKNRLLLLGIIAPVKGKTRFKLTEDGEKALSTENDIIVKNRPILNIAGEEQ